MRIGITGGSGFIGRAFLAACPRDDVQFVRFVRPTARAREEYVAAKFGEAARYGGDITAELPMVPPFGSEMVWPRSFAHPAHEVETLVPGEIHVPWQPDDPHFDTDAVEGLDAVVHLAGENIARHRWTESFKQKLTASRVDATHFLTERLAALDRPPAVFVSVSAVGFYGDRGDETTDESVERGDGFLAHLVEQWEAAAEPIVLAGARTVFARMGMVLGREGGAIPKMLVPFRLGLGGRIGSGRQFVSWIDQADAAAALWHLIENDSLHGPVNVTSPNPVRNVRFTKALAVAIHRPAFIPAERHAVRLLLGELAEDLLLRSLAAVPHALLESGFKFNYPEIEDSLRHILGHRK